MKKLLIALFLLLTVAAFAIESAPSAVVGYVKYDCITTDTGNLNFIALPMNSGYTYASDLANAFPSKMDAISMWDSASQSWVQASDLGGFWDGDFEIAPGAPLMIYCLENFSLYSMGSVPSSDPQYPIVVGLNSLMIPLTQQLSYASDLGLSLGTVDAISTWDASSQSWVQASDLGGFWDGDFDITVGKPLMVYSFSETSWPSAPAKKVSTNNSHVKTVK